MLNRSALARIRYAVDDSREWTIKLEGSYNFQKQDSYLQPAIQWQRNNIELEAGFDLFSGKTDSFFGAYSGNDRGYLKGKYLF